MNIPLELSQILCPFSRVGPPLEPIYALVIGPDSDAPSYRVSFKIQSYTDWLFQ